MSFTPESSVGNSVDITPALVPVARRDGESGGAAGRAANLEDGVYLQIRQALIDGHFRPGQTLTLRSLAASLGTSPMPVRDALKRLVAERALDVLPNRTVIVPLMSRARFQEILQIRLSLESMITLRAATRIAPHEIELMAADHRGMCDAVARGDATGFLAANRSFHFRLYRAAGTIVMLSVIESMWMQIGPYLNQVFSSRNGATDTADHHHMAILQALRRRDESAAAKALWQDLSDAADGILSSNLFSE